MTQTRLIVVERDGKWAAALRRELENLPVRLHETRSLDECRQRLAEWPTALAAVELTESNAPKLLAALFAWEREFPQAAMLVLAERRLAAYSDVIREAGAIHFICSPRRLNEVADLLRRRAVKNSEAAAADDELIASLPWSDEEK